MCEHEPIFSSINIQHGEVEPSSHYSETTHLHFLNPGASPSSPMRLTPRISVSPPSVCPFLVDIMYYVDSSLHPSRVLNMCIQTTWLVFLQSCFLFYWWGFKIYVRKIKSVWITIRLCIDYAATSSKARYERRRADRQTDGYEAAVLLDLSCHVMWSCVTGQTAGSNPASVSPHR